MNLDRPVTIEDVTASAEAQLRELSEECIMLSRRLGWADKKLAAYERYAGMLKKKLDRYRRLVMIREDD